MKYDIFIPIHSLYTLYGKFMKEILVLDEYAIHSDESAYTERERESWFNSSLYSPCPFYFPIPLN